MDGVKVQRCAYPVELFRHEAEGASYARDWGFREDNMAENGLEEFFGKCVE